MSRWRSFEAAREWARSQGIQTMSEWRLLQDRPVDIPANPNQIYKYDGWTGYGDWLGTYRVANADRGFLRFNTARDRVRAIKIKSQSAYFEWAKTDARPTDIPANPHHVYAEEGWTGWEDWLGKDGLARVEWLTYEDARSVVLLANLTSQKEWKNWRSTASRPANIPSKPDEVYAGKGWVGWPDFLGYDRKRKVK